MMNSVTVIVCSYRRPENLASCLASLESQDFPGIRILVVGVEDDYETRRIVAQSSAGLVLQSHPKGISAARNLGISKCATAAVAFIDDDARARVHWASSLLRGLFDSGMGGVGGPVFDTRTGRQVVRPWRVDCHGVTHDAVEMDAECGLPTINGCNMAFTREALKKVGGFDPYYRYYYDETDVCVRLARYGYGVGYVDGAIVDHDFAEGPTRERFLYFSSRMRAYFSMKNFRGLVSTPRLLFGQGMTLKDDFRVYRRLHPKYAGLSGFRRAVQEVTLGRLEGIVDGSIANRTQVPDSMVDYKP